MQLEALLNYPRALPAMPRAVTELLGEMNKEDPSPRRVGQLIGQDPALTTRVLRLSNSAFFRVSRRIGNADEAVAMLGMTHVRSLVMAAALGASFKNVPGIDLGSSGATACAWPTFPSRWPACCSRTRATLSRPG